MSAPNVTFFINSNDQETTDYIVTLNSVDVGGDCQEMRFSNNTVEWSPWYLFSASHSWDLRLYGGSFTHGQRYVFAEFRNGDGVTDDSDDILLVAPAPRAEFVTDPSQRNDGSKLVDIPYIGVERHILGPSIDLIQIEYDLYGTFTGNEKPLSVKDNDPSHTGVTGLLFTNAGEDQNIVWDLLEDVDADQFWNTCKVRFKCHYGEYTSDWFATDEFSISTRAVDPDEKLGKKGKPGDSIRIELSLFDSDGNPVDADADPTITSIKDPDGVEKVVTPFTMIHSDVGYYYYDYTTSQSDPEGQWMSVITYTINGNVETQDAPFYLENDYIVVTPSRDNVCRVYGTLYCENGDPASGVDVMILHDDISDPGHFNPTVIGMNPIIATTDSNGFFSVDVIRNSEVIVYIKSLGYRRRAKIPDDVSVKFTDMSLVLPTPPRDQFGNRT